MKKVQFNEKNFCEMFETLSEEECCEVEAAGCGDGASFGLCGGGCQVPSYFDQAW